MFTEQQKHNANLLFQAMRVQDAATKAEFAQTALNSFIHCGAESLLAEPLDIAILQQAREILKKVSTNDAFDKLVQQTA
jgi:hypothetical protein